MKVLKSIPVLVLGIVLTLSGCSTKSATTSAQASSDRTQTIQSLGLEYSVPEEWDKIVDTNVFRFIVAPDDAFAMVRYSYATIENLEYMSSNPFDTSTSLDEYLTPICAILIFERSSEDTPAIARLTQSYNSQEKLGEQGDYIYYGLWDYSDTSKIDNASSLDKEGYKKLSSSASKLMGSVKTFDFDPEEILSQTSSKDTMTFMTKTLWDEEISSVVFSSYDVTMVYFWASYCLPDINELSELQRVYETLQESHPNTNLILAAIDTPNEDGEALIRQAMSEAGCTFTAIKMDELLGSWVLNNLQGLPTSVFVDKNGEIDSEFVTGVQEAGFYLNKISSYSGEVSDIPENS